MTDTTITRPDTETLDEGWAGSDGVEDSSEEDSGLNPDSSNPGGPIRGGGDSGSVGGGRGDGPSDPEENSPEGDGGEDPDEPSTIYGVSRPVFYGGTGVMFWTAPSGFRVVAHTDDGMERDLNDELGAMVALGFGLDEGAGPGGVPQAVMVGDVIAEGADGTEQFYVLDVAGRHAVQLTLDQVLAAAAAAVRHLLETAITEEGAEGSGDGEAPVVEGEVADATGGFEHPYSGKVYNTDGDHAEPVGNSDNGESSAQNPDDADGGNLD